MQRFYISEVNGNSGTLGAEESWHCVKVLRLQNGDTIELIDGKGGLYKAEIENASPKACSLRIIKEHQEPAPAWELHVVIAPTKNIARIEWLIEKLTEIGITEFIPILSEHSERRVLKNERLQKITLEAIKQSGRTYLPKLHELTSFDKMLTDSKDFKGQKFVLHCIEKDKETFTQTCKKGENAMVLIGPEGDFTNTEVEQAIGHGFTPITLGNHRLRTETAALVAAVTLHTLNS